MPTATKSKYTPIELAEFKRQRIEAIRIEGAIRRVTCPTCGAAPGEPCHTTPAWWPTDHHAPRRRAAGL